MRKKWQKSEPGIGDLMAQYEEVVVEFHCRVKWAW